MTKTLGRLDPKTRIVDMGEYMIETDGLVPISNFDLPIAGGKLITHMWTLNTTGGLVAYQGIDEKPHTIYLAREMGIIKVLFFQFLSAGSTLAANQLFWGRTANHMYEDQI